MVGEVGILAVAVDVEFLGHALAPGKSRVLFPVGGDIRLVAVEYLPCVETDGLQGDLRAGAFTAVQPSGLEIQPDAYIYFLFSLWCHIFSGLDE